MKQPDIFPRVFQTGTECTLRIKGITGILSMRIAYKNSGEILYAAGSSEISEVNMLFPRSGEYYVFISASNMPDSRISVYSVSEKLSGLIPLRGDMHMHTLYSDGAQSPREMVIQGRRLGLDYIAVTDHDSYFPSIEAAKFAQESGIDMLMFEGEEVTVPTGGHVLSIGADAPLHLKDMDSAALKKLVEDEDEDAVYGGMKLVMRMIQERGGFSVLCHPFWMVEDTGFYHLPRHVLFRAVKDRLPDALEIPGDTLPQDNMIALNFYYGQTDRDIPIISNSDTHSTSHTYGDRWQTVFVREKTKTAVLHALKNFMSVACEKHGDGIINIYGDFELSEYAYFLCREYFPHKNKIASAEAELITSGLHTSDIKTASDKYTYTFFGIQS